MKNCLILSSALGFKVQHGFNMTKMPWMCLFLWVVLSVGFSQTDTSSEEGSSMGFLNLRLDLAASARIVHVSAVKASNESHKVLTRQKRNILFPNGVKLCAQETPQQVMANHLSYFHLRVCQETIWEAFKIFWDRLPKQEEYQSWMTRCQEGAVGAQDVGSFFSQSEEHQAMVVKRMSLPGIKSEPTKSWQHMCSTTTQSSAEAVEAPHAADQEETKEIKTASATESPLDNDIPLQPAAPPAGLEQVVELSLLLSGESYSEDLDDPKSLKYQTLSRQLEDKIEDALKGLPGYKSVSVIAFRQQKDVQGQEAVMLNYAVTVSVNGAGVSNQQLDFLTLQSNLVESSYRDVHNDMDMDNTLETMSESPESVRAADADTVVSPEILTLDYDTEDEPSETVTMATAGNDVVVLEESEVVPPVLELEISAHEAGSMEEEGLLVGDTEQVPAAETPTKLPETVTLPGPPVEIESSGLGVVDTKVLLEPYTTTEELNKVSSEDSELLSEQVHNSPEAEEEESPDNLEDQQQSEDVEDEDGDSEEFEVSTVTPEITDYELLPAQVPPPDVNMEINPLEPEVSDTNQAQDEGPALEVPDHAPVEDLNVMSEEHNQGSEVNPEILPESDAPQISLEDLTEDEILLVNQDKPPVTESSGPAQPTVLSPESLSPFTQINVDVILEAKPEVGPSIEEIQTPNMSSEDVPTGDHSFDVFQLGLGLINHTEEGSTGFPFSIGQGTDQVSMAMPVNPGRALMVFFSLRVTNMIFSEDLFNKSSPEYKALEQRFLELLVPYLQSNLSHFENLEILNFRNGSIVVNSRMKFGKPVADGVKSTVYLILEDFCNTAYQTMNLAIDKYSLDVESGDQADPCKFQACNEYAECKVNKWTGEAECVCNAGYFSVDGLPCQSICDLQDDFCLNDGKCDIIPGQGAICRCRVGENWWYRGEHCEEYVSEPLVVGIAIASVAGFLLVASGVIFFLARTLRDQYDKDESEDPIRHAENLPSLERATKYNPMYESEATTGYSHYYRRYPEVPVYSSASAEASTDFSSEEIRHIYENSELTKEEIQDRIRIIELYAKDRQFADFGPGNSPREFLCSHMKLFNEQAAFISGEVTLYKDFFIDPDVAPQFSSSHISVGSPPEP